MRLRRVVGAEVIGGQHDPERAQDRARRVGEEGGDARQRLLLFGVEHVQDGAGQQRVRRLLPVIAPFLGPFRIDQDVGDVLHVAHLLRALAHLEQRIEAGGEGIGRIEQQAMGELGAPAGGEHPVLALDVVHDGRAGPGQQGGHHQADALARPRRRDRQHMLGAIVAQIAVPIETEDDAAIAQQPCLVDIGSVRPAGRAVGCGLLLAAGPPGGSPERDQAGGNSPECRNGAGTRKHAGCLAVERQPPGEQFPRRVELEAREIDPGCPERRLVAEHRRRPLRRGDETSQRDGDGQQTLTDGGTEGRHDRWPFARRNIASKGCVQINASFNRVNCAGS